MVSVRDEIRRAEREVAIVSAVAGFAVGVLLGALARAVGYGLGAWFAP